MRAAGVVLALALIPVSGCAASKHDFDAVVSAVSARYPAHLQEVPMMGLVSFCAQMVTVDGVKGLKVAQFDNFRHAPDAAELESLVRDTLGSEWQPFVTTRSRAGDTTLIFSQPDGRAMRLMIADYEHGELNLVRIEVDGERMQHWLNHPQESAQQHDYGQGRVAD